MTTQPDPTIRDELEGTPMTDRELAVADLARIVRELKAIGEDNAESLRSGEIADIIAASWEIESLATRIEQRQPSIATEP